MEAVARILVPLDGSALAEAVLPAAEALARDYRAELLLLRAFRMPGLDAPDREADLTSARAYLSRIGSQLKAQGVPRVRWTLSPSPAAEAIAEAAGRESVDLIAMATHGRGALARLLLGSVAQAVTRLVSAPVLLVRGSSAWTRRSIGSILVPLDGSPAAEGVLPVVARLAGPVDQAIHLLHVIEPVPAYAAAEAAGALGEAIHAKEAAARELLARTAHGVEAKGLRVHTAVRTGPVVGEIRDYATANGIGLVAMTTHGRTGLARALMGTVSERVLHDVPVPVLLWRARREEQRAQRVAA